MERSDRNHGKVARDMLTADAVLRLRRDVYHDGVATRAEAETLLARDGEAHAPAWRVFLVEAVSDFVVFAEPPVGHVSPANAAWLMAAVSRGVQPGTAAALYATVVEKARSVPASFSAFILDEVARAVIDGEGTLAGAVSRGQVDAGTAAYLRRVLHAAGGEDNIGVSRAEAEVLFRINESCSGNDAAFDDLFVKAVASFLLTVSGREVASREMALDAELAIDRDRPDLAGFFARMVSGGMSAILEAAASDHSVEAEFRALNARRLAAETRAAALDHDEVEWLAKRIGRSGRPNRNEKALMAFLSANASSVHPDLDEVLRKVG